MHVLLLGVNGLIGSHLVATLEASGHRVTGLGRALTSARRRHPLRRVLAADLRRMTAPPAWVEALREVDAVVNCAGALQDGPQDDLAAVHVAAPLALYRAC